MSKVMKKPKHLPNSMRSAIKQLTVTFPLYCEILLGVNLDIQTVLLSLKMGGASTTHLRNGGVLPSNSDIKYVEKSRAK